MSLPVATPLRVLVVEDHHDTSSSLAILLNLLGYLVEIASDGEAAVRAAQSIKPDVILLDLGLPKLDGWQVARLVREQAVGKRPWIVAISGLGTAEDRRRSQEACINLHLLKPVDPDYLRDLLCTAQQLAFWQEGDPVTPAAS